MRNLTDDGKDYSYVSDAFGRLKTVKNRGNSAVVAEYTYNGLNMRIDGRLATGVDARHHSDPTLVAAARAICHVRHVTARQAAEVDLESPGIVCGFVRRNSLK